MGSGRGTSPLRRRRWTAALLHDRRTAAGRHPIGQAAASLARRLLELDLRDAGRQMEDLVIARNACAAVAEQLGDHPEAERLLHASLVALRQQRNAAPDLLAATLVDLGNCLRRQGRYDESRLLLVEAVRLTHGRDRTLFEAVQRDLDSLTSVKAGEP